MWDTLSRPSAERAEAFRVGGWWRDETILDDLHRGVATDPDKPAIISYVDDSLDRIISYRELAQLVDRIAAGLMELGVGRGDVVAIYLPNWWMLSPLYLSCARIGAVPAPVMPILGVHDLRQVLRTSAAKVCVVGDRYNGVDYVQRLADAAPETLQHRVVVRTSTAAGDDDLIDFAAHFVDTPWEQRHQLPPLSSLRADDVSLLLFTSGTTGAPKGVAHSHNTLHAAAIALPNCWGWGSEIVVSVPHPMTHLAGTIFSCYMSLILGGTSVMQDQLDMALLLDMIEKHRLTFVYAGPVLVRGLVAEQRKKPRDLSGLRKLISGSAPIPPQMVADVREVLGVELGALWGMTENGPVTVTRPDDPEGWAANSDGSVVPGSEFRIDAEAGATIGRLLVRGPSQCLGYLNQREAYEKCLEGDWFDTGDTARPDGRGGIRITGRRDDLIMRRLGIKVPTLEIEAVIERHPNVREIALIGYPDVQEPTADCVCAMIVPDGEPPTLDELTGYLDEVGVSWLHWPDRIEIREQLPRNSMGKLQRTVLRQELQQLVGGPADVRGA